MAVALVEPVLGAETPNRVLNEARKIGGERRIEVTCIELAGDAINDLGTAAGVGLVLYFLGAAGAHLRARHYDFGMWSVFFALAAAALLVSLFR